MAIEPSPAPPRAPLPPPGPSTDAGGPPSPSGSDGSDRLDRSAPSTRTTRTTRTSRTTRAVRTARWTVGRVVALVFGCLLILPAIAVFASGAVLGVATLVQRDDDGYFDVTLERLTTETVALQSSDISFAAEPGDPDWLIDALDADVRLRVRPAEADAEVFVGIAREDDVDEYLSGVAHDEVVDVHEDLEGDLRRRDGVGVDDGEGVVTPPADEGFWVVSSFGREQQVVEWEATNGRWAVVVMNVDASPGVVVDVDVGVRSGVLGWLALGLLIGGALAVVLAVVLLVVGIRGPRGRFDSPTTSTASTGTTASTRSASAEDLAVRHDEPAVAMSGPVAESVGDRDEVLAGADAVGDRLSADR